MTTARVPDGAAVPATDATTNATAGPSGAAASPDPSTDARTEALAAARDVFEDAQREADTVFAQYQLSQLLALGGELPLMAASVVSELVRDSDAVAGALWLAAPDDALLDLVSYEGPGGPDGAGPSTTRSRVPTRFAGSAAAADWCRAAGWHGVALDERRDLGDRSLDARIVGFLALRPPDGATLAADRIHFLSLVRHELAIAFRGAQLRETLSREQALLAAILDGASDAIVAVDSERRVVRLNQAAVRLLGATQARQRAWTCRELFGCGGLRDATGREERLRCGPRCRFEEVLAGPDQLVECEQTVVARDGTEIPVAASYAWMPGPAGAVAVLRDLRAVRAIEELRTSFIDAVSHELRTPLALISGYVDSLLGLELDPDTQRRSVARIGEAADRLTALVDEILELTHVEGDRLALRREVVDVAEVVERVTADVAERPGSRAVRVEIPADLPRPHADGMRLGRVIANLVDNAQKYGGDGPVTVVARPEGSSILVTVRDRGPGIPAEDRPHVFDRFYRGSGVRGRRTPGNGLGLYVCRRLVEAHGGRIWLDATAVGTAVSFTLPLGEPARPGRSAP